MDKLAAIGVDISTGARATLSFWKHVCQLIVELLSFGYLQFELERGHISEASLKDIHGRYLKFKLKHSGETANDRKSEVSLTPFGETLL